ncbi:tetratricopeptide repeat protein [Mesorhizobium yinganensis]|uniref:tetratricopeptide repeat protein n=1 Tax=Mesorhizobium yinganensis TaxID=3157707 RepID=UPI0032B7F141
MNYTTASSGPSFDLQISKGSKKLVLFFSGVGARDGRFQYWRVGKSLGTHCLFLSDGRKHWYQDGVEGLGSSVDETVVNIRRQAAALGVTGIYAIGQSMGAYGAILYGAKLGASVLAFGAETILGLEASRSERLRRDDAAILYPNLHDVIASAEKPVFAFAGEEDPVDLYCASKASGLPNYHPRTIAGQGHHLAAYLHQTDRLIPLLRAFVDGPSLPFTGEEGDALACSGLADAFYDLHRHMWAGRPVEAIEAGRRTISIKGDLHVALYLTAKALLGTGQASEAVGFAEKALALAPNNASYKFLLANSLTKLGELDRAMTLLKEAIAAEPDLAAAHNQIAGIHYRQGNFPAAREASRRALQLQPGHPTYTRLLDRIEKRIALLSTQDASPEQDASSPLAAKVTNLFRSLKGTVVRRS